MTAFVTLDLFRLVADAEAARRGLPRASLFLSPQTQRNLQLVALSAIVVAASKDALTNPWPHLRMTELGVEQWFGRLRLQSASAQLSVRSYYQASAREMLRARRKKQREEKNGGEGSCTQERKKLEAIRGREFHEASSRALQSSLLLVGWCSEISTESLEEKYREWCQDARFTFNDDAEDEDWELQEECHPAVEVEGDCEKLLRAIEEEAGAHWNGMEWFGNGCVLYHFNHLIQFDS